MINYAHILLFIRALFAAQCYKDNIRRVTKNKYLEIKSKKFVKIAL